MKYVYDAQIRTILCQITRIFSQFSIPYSVDENGKEVLRRVPARYAGTDALVQSIITNNTENFLLAIPFIAVSIDTIDIDRSRIGTTGAYNKEKISTRKWDNDLQTYTHEEGNRYEIHRYQGFPIKLAIKVNIFTTNLTQKLQIFEQLCLIFNPSMDFQTSTSPMDYHRLNTLTLDRVQFSDKNFPIDISKGSYETMTLSFSADCYIDPPAQVDIQRNIEEIVTNMSSNIEDPSAYDLSPANRIESVPKYFKFEILDQVLSDGSYSGKYLIKIIGDTTWEKMLKNYGIYESGISQFRLRCLDWNTDNQFDKDGNEKKDYEVVGTFQVPSIDNPEQEQYNDNIAIWTIDKDTYPEITLGTIDGIVDPHVQIPQKQDITNWINRDEKIQTVEASDGIRYILLDNIGSNTKAWGKFYDHNGNIIEEVHANDIIQYRKIGNFGKWIRIFDSENSKENQYVYSSFDKRIYQYSAGNWNELVNGVWQGGRVRLICKPFSGDLD